MIIDVDDDVRVDQDDLNFDDLFSAIAGSFDGDGSLVIAASVRWRRPLAQSN